MIAGLFLFTPELKMPEHQQIDTGNIISSVAEKPASASQPATHAPKQLTNADISAPDIPEKADIASGRTNDQVKTPFHLIAASFKYEAPAQQTAEQMKKEGFPDAKVLLNGNGRFRVALESFEKRDSAVERLFALREDPKFENVWLLDDLSGK
jgi:cell division protein FtsN